MKYAVLLLCLACIRTVAKKDTPTPTPDLQAPARDSLAEAIDTIPGIPEHGVVVSGVVSDKIIAYRATQSLSTFVSVNAEEISFSDDTRTCSNARYSVTPIGHDADIIHNGFTDAAGRFQFTVSTVNDIMIQFPSCRIRCLANPPERQLICDPLSDLSSHYFNTKGPYPIAAIELGGARVASYITGSAEALRLSTLDHDDPSFNKALSVCRSIADRSACLAELGANTRLPALLPAYKEILERHLYEVGEGQTAQGFSAPHLTDANRILSHYISLGIDLSIDANYIQTLFNSDTIAQSHADQKLATTLRQLIGITPTYQPRLLCQVDRIDDTGNAVSRHFFQPDANGTSLDSICPIIGCRSATARNNCQWSRLVVSNQIMPDFRFDYSAKSLRPYITLTASLWQTLIDDTGQARQKTITLRPTEAMRDLLTQFATNDHLRAAIFTDTIASTTTSSPLKAHAVLGLATTSVATQAEVPIFCNAPDFINPEPLFCTTARDYLKTYGQYKLRPFSPDAVILSPITVRHHNTILSAVQIKWPNGAPFYMHNRPVIVANLSATLPCNEDPYTEITLDIMSRDGRFDEHRVYAHCQDLNRFQINDTFNVVQGPLVDVLVSGQRKQLPSVLHNGIPLCVDTSPALTVDQVRLSSCASADANFTYQAIALHPQRHRSDVVIALVNRKTRVPLQMAPHTKVTSQRGFEGIAIETLSVVELERFNSVEVGTLVPLQPGYYDDLVIIQAPTSLTMANAVYDDRNNDKKLQCQAPDSFGPMLNIDLCSLQHRPLEPTFHVIDANALVHWVTSLHDQTGPLPKTPYADIIYACNDGTKATEIDFLARTAKGCPDGQVVLRRLRQHENAPRYAWAQTALVLRGALFSDALTKESIWHETPKMTLRQALIAIALSQTPLATHGAKRADWIDTQIAGLQQQFLMEN